MMPPMIRPTMVLNCEESKALYDWITLILVELGGQPGDVFNWCEQDNINQPLTSALFKLYESAGSKRPIPRTKAEWADELRKEQEAIAKGASNATS